MLFYSSEIFKSGGSSPKSALYATIALGFCASLGAVLGSLLIKYLTRRGVWILGQITCAVFLSGISLGFLVKQPVLQISSTLIFMACFTSTLGPIGWSYIAEILQINQLGIATSFHWIVTGVISVVIPYMLTYEPIGGKFTFLFFAIPTLLGILFSVFIMKETKERNPHDLKRLFATSSNVSIK